MLLYLCGIAMIVMGGLLSLKMPDATKAKTVSAFTGIGSIFAVYPCVKVLAGSEPLFFTFSLSKAFGDVRLMIDMLSAFFVIVISVVSFLGSLYAIGYIRPYCDKNKALGGAFSVFQPADCVNAFNRNVSSRACFSDCMGNHVAFLIFSADIRA